MGVGVENEALTGSIFVPQWKHACDLQEGYESPESSSLDAEEAWTVEEIMYWMLDEVGTCQTLVSWL